MNAEINKREEGVAVSRDQGGSEVGEERTTSSWKVRTESGSGRGVIERRESDDLYTHLALIVAYRLGIYPKTNNNIRG